jgi:PKD repeat protein
VLVFSVDTTNSTLGTNRAMVCAMTISSKRIAAREMVGRVSAGFLLLFVLTAFGGIIPSDRRVTWQGNVGVSNGIPNRTTIYTTLAAGASLSSVQSALNACPANQVVKLSAGSYSWSGTLDWVSVKSGVVLRGAGASTVVTFSSGGISMRGTVSESALSTEANLNADAVKGSSTLSLASVPSWVTVGKLIAVDQIDDTSFVCGYDGIAGEPGEGGDCYRYQITGERRGLGQLVRVLAKTSTSITTEIPIYYGFKTAQTAQIFQPFYDPSSATPRAGCGIENMKLAFSFTDGNQKAIYMECCDSCWVKGVEIANFPGAPAIFMLACYRCEIRDSYVHDSRALSAGQGYGITMYHFSSGNLVENNIISGVHAGANVNYGSSGNVMAYNYMFNGLADSGQFACCNTHGVHTYMNLWEGNYGTFKVLADFTHGSSSHNTVYRCRLAGTDGNNSDGDSRCVVSIEMWNRYWNIVGNLLGTTNSQNKYVEYQGDATHGSLGTIFKIGGEVNINDDFSPYDAYSYTTGSKVLIGVNWDCVTTTNGGLVYDKLGAGNWTTNDLDNSLYLASKPAFFGAMPWPPYNPGVHGGTALAATNIPAGYRYTFGVDPPAGTGVGNQPPVVSATGSPTTGLAPLAVAFSSTGSSDPEGAALSYAWSFGDGATSTSANPSHTYATNGVYVARLTVSDGTNSASSSDITIRIGNSSPIAVASATPSSGAPPLTVAFSSAGCSDPEGTGLSYTWAFGDGTNSTAANPSHTYLAAGTYAAKLTVSDGVNIVSSSNIVITVSDQAPTVALSSPSNGRSYVAPASIPLTATVATNGHAITKVQFYCNATLVGEDAAAPYSLTWSNVSAGNYNLFARMVYDAGTVDSASVTVTVTNPSPSVVLTSPSNGASYTPPATIVCAAAVTANGHSLTKVQFYSDATLLGEAATAPYSISWSNVSVGNYNLAARLVYDTGGTVDSVPVSVVVATVMSNTLSGLVAAYGFDEGTGTSVTDASGKGNPGSLNGAAWNASGKFGSGLSFDGVSSCVVIPNSASLALSNRMSLEAWVFPTVALSGWRCILQKEVDTYLLHASSGSDNKPATGATYSGGVKWVAGGSTLPVSTWSHLAATYDGTTIRLFVNGTQVATLAQAGNIVNTSSALRIGGNTYAGEFFNGLIDEVRVYNRALSASEIQADMIRPVSGSSSQSPVVVAGAVPGADEASLTVAFSSVGSSDPGGAALSYSWSFGDGTTSTEANPSHTYLTSSSVTGYSVRLTVSTGSTSSSTNLTVIVKPPPPPGLPRIQAP